MTTSTDSYWDDLGLSWRAINPDASAIGRRLSVRLRSMAAWAYAMMIFGLPLSVTMLGLGVFTIWRGASTGVWNFVTRGVALIIMGALIALASWSQRTRTLAETNGLAQMMDLAVLRAQKLRQAALMGIYICAVAAAFGTVGYFIRRHSGWRPHGSPLEPLALLALASLALTLYTRRASDDLKRLRYLKKALVPESNEGT